jgi:hypothetical protein
VASTRERIDWTVWVTLLAAILGAAAGGFFTWRIELSRERHDDTVAVRRAQANAYQTVLTEFGRQLAFMDYLERCSAGA